MPQVAFVAPLGRMRRRGEHASKREDVHSDKPDCALQWFERHWPNTPKIEFNAKRARPGWHRWGLDAPETESTPMLSPVLMPDRSEDQPKDDPLSIPDFLDCRDQRNGVLTASAVNGP